jgi:hypothetical protein
MQRMDDAERALVYLSEIDITGVATYGKRYLDAPPPRFVPRASVAQAVVVGNQLQAYAEDVAIKQRETLQNAMLLAQLVATRQAGDDTEA